MDESHIREFLERLGRALSSGDLDGVVDCWEVPALVLSDEGVVPVTGLGEVRGFFAGAAEWYRSQGLVTTRPEAIRVERLSEKLSAVDVRWPGFDAEGIRKATERSYYILRAGEDGRPHIRLAVTRKDP